MPASTRLFPLASPACGHDHLSQFTEMTDDLGNYIPLEANRLYISSASCLDSGARAIRSKIDSKPSPRLYARTTCVCRNVFGVNSLSMPVFRFNSSKIIRRNRSENGNNVSSTGYFSRYWVYTAVNLAGNATLRSFVVCFPVCLIHSSGLYGSEISTCALVRRNNSLLFKPVSRNNKTNRYVRGSALAS